MTAKAHNWYYTFRHALLEISNGLEIFMANYLIDVC